MAASVRYWRGFCTPRRGHVLADCEDAFAARPERGRFAVADGAAESCHAGAWARQLVETFADEVAPWPDWIVPAHRSWSEQVKRRPEDGPLPWYLEERERNGAFSTFLGAIVDETGWQALAVGDSCLFHVRNQRLELAFPLTHSSQFGNAPWLIGSRSAKELGPLERATQVNGDRKAGDRLLLMTDALARWALLETESGRRPWLQLGPVACETEEAFVAEVERLRAERTLRNDDATLVVIGL